MIKAGNRLHRHGAADPLQGAVRPGYRPGLRLSPETGKQNCLILDATGATGRHNLMSVAEALGLTGKPLKDGESLLDHLQAEAEQAEREKSSVQHHDGEVRSRVKDLVRRAMHWVETLRGAYAMDAGGQYFRIRQQAEDRWLVERRTRDEKAYTLLAEGLPLPYCFGVAEDTARALKVGWATNPKAGWRNGPPSEEQLKLCEKFHVEIQPGWNRGQVSDAFARMAGDWFWPRG